MSDNGATIPHNKEAEESILGCILIDNDAFLRVHDVITHHSFYIGQYGRIYETICQMIRAGTAVDILTLPVELERQGIEHSPSELIRLINIVPTAINARSYARQVRDLDARRRLIREANKIVTEAYNGEQSVDELLADAETAVSSILLSETDDRLIYPQQLANDFIDELNSDEPVGLSTGYADLDRMIGGLEKQSVYIFAAAEKMGKTAFVNGISLHNALYQDKVVLRASLEMSAKQRMRRDVSRLSKLSISQLKQRYLNEAEMKQAYECVAKINECRLAIDDRGALRPSQLRMSMSRVLMRYGRLDLVEVDYFQLMEPDDKNSNRVNELDSISRSIAQLAKGFDVPIVMTAQVVSKSIDTRKEKRPHLSDVYGSSSLQRDAYFIAFIYRDEYYNPDTTERPGIAEVIIRAHRDGATGQVDLYFNGPTASFRNLERKEFQL